MARLLIVAWAAALFWFSGLALDLPHSVVSSQLTLKEELIGEKSPEALIEPQQDTISPDGKHVAWREKRGTEWLFVVDGTAEGRGYDEVRFANFSPDSQHLAYWARRGKIWTVVIDQKEEGAYSNSGSTVVFSSDSAHHAYWVSGEKWKKHFIVSDSVRGPRFDDVDLPLFSPKTQRLIYSATQGKASIIVDNGQETPRKLRSRVYGFTPGEEKLILLEEEPGRGTKQRYAFGAEVGPWFDAFSPVVFGATDDHFAYAGARIRWGELLNWTITQGDNQASGQVVVDGLAGSTYKGEELAVSSGRSNWEPPRWENAIDSGIQRFSAPRYGVSAPVISPDGHHIAYTARVAKKHYAVMLDGQEIDSFEYTSCDPAFSPSGDLYYAGFHAKNFVVTGNGKILSQLPVPEKKEYDQYGCDVEFKPPAHFITRLIWRADLDATGNRKDGIGWRGRVFVDGLFGPEQVMGGEFDVQFSGDQFHTVFKVDEDVAKTSRSYIVLDGREGKSYDQILGRFPHSVHFTGEGEVTFIARSGTKFIRVTQARSVDEPIR